LDVVVAASFDVVVVASVVPAASAASFEVVVPELVVAWPAAVISCVEPTAVASLRVVVSVPVAWIADLRALGSSEPAC
jgi:hypothetical protein